MEDFDQIKHMVLKQLNRCVVCHRAYEYTDITSVQRKPGVWTLMVECEQCRSRNYIAAVTSDGTTDDAILEVQSLTRRALGETPNNSFSMEREDEAEAQRFGTPVTAGDVIDMHDFLKDFDGNFERLFRSR